jgi:MFS transporter, ACS family, solute carrier family 17 (sodium-dependent inorganic phosphate cotransporter), other
MPVEQSSIVHAMSQDAEGQGRPGPARVPHRITVALICFVALVIAYCDRVNVAVAAPQIMAQRHWDTAQMSWVLSGFFLGYALFLIPSGILVQRVGARRVLLCSIAGWSVFTALTPHPQSLPGMYSARLLLGIFESAIFPVINSLLSDWFPREEYAKAAGFCWSGGYAGPILAFPVASMILAAWGWKSIFYIFGAAGLVWMGICWRLLSAGPVQHKDQAQALPEMTVGLELLSRRPVWAVFLLHFSSNWFIYVLLTWLPTYLINVRGFSGSLAAVGSSLPFLSALVGSNFFALAIAHLSKRRNPTVVRKVMLLVFVAGAVVFTLLPKIHDSSAVVAALAASTALITAATPVYAAGSLELAPKAAGLLAGMQQAFANTAGILAPLATGYLARVSWSFVFLAAFAVCVAGAAAYAFFGSAETVYGVSQQCE